MPIRSYSLGGGAALVVHPALSASTFSQRLEPAVYHDGAQLACVFMGHLENLGELATRYDCTSEEGLPPSPTSVMGGDPRQLAAACIAAMYHKERSGDLIVLLSELQVGGWAGGLGVLWCPSRLGLGHGQRCWVGICRPPPWTDVHGNGVHTWMLLTGP